MLQSFHEIYQQVSQCVKLKTTFSRKLKLLATLYFHYLHVYLTIKHEKKPNKIQKGHWLYIITTLHVSIDIVDTHHNVPLKTMNTNNLAVMLKL